MQQDMTSSGEYAEIGSERGNEAKTYLRSKQLKLMSLNPPNWHIKTCPRLSETAACEQSIHTAHNIVYIFVTLDLSSWLA